MQVQLCLNMVTYMYLWTSVPSDLWLHCPVLKQNHMGKLNCVCAPLMHLSESLRFSTHTTGELHPRWHPCWDRTVFFKWKRCQLHTSFLATMSISYYQMCGHYHFHQTLALLISCVLILLFNIVDANTFLLGIDRPSPLHWVAMALAS